MEITYNKLVRDKIPEIIKQDGKTAVIEKLDNDRYKEELLRKLKEECDEAINAKNRSDLVEELADIMEVIKSIASYENCSFNDLLKIMEEKADKRGSFEKKLFLVKTIVEEK